MTYVLETITPEDQEKILRDAECDERKKKILIKFSCPFTQLKRQGSAQDLDYPFHTVSLKS